MALNNQMLAGSVCIVILAVVVAVTTKPFETVDAVELKTIEMHEVPDGDRPLAEVEALRQRWRTIRFKPTLDAVGDFVRDTKKVRDVNKLVYEKRAVVLTSDSLKKRFDEEIHELLHDSEVVLLTVVQEDSEVPIQFVPARAGTETRTTVPTAAQDGATLDFTQGDEISLSQRDVGFHSTNQLADNMIDEYAEITPDPVPLTKKREDSAFVSQPDALNDASNMDGGKVAEAMSQDHAGLTNDKAPAQTVAVIEMLGDPDISDEEWPAGDRSFYDEHQVAWPETGGDAVSEWPSFNAIGEPQAEFPEPEIASKKRKEPPPSKSILEAAKKKLARRDAPSFNENDETQFGSENESEILRLTKLIESTEDPSTRGELQRQLNDRKRVQTVFRTQKISYRR